MVPRAGILWAVTLVLFTRIAGLAADVKPVARVNGEGLFVRGQMAKPSEDAAHTLKPGEISRVVATDYGYHITKVEDHTSALVRSEADAAQEARSYLESYKLNQVVKDYVKQLRSTAKIEVLLGADREDGARIVCAAFRPASAGNAGHRRRSQSITPNASLALGRRES